jgi:hypothetical protein
MMATNITSGGRFKYQSIKGMAEDGGFVDINELLHEEICLSRCPSRPEPLKLVTLESLRES